MQDCLGRELRVGSLITYCTRSGSCQWINVAVIDSLSRRKKRSWALEGELGQEVIKATVIAGSGSKFRHGRWVYDPVTGTGEHLPYEGRKVTLSVSNTILLIDGVDAEALKKACLDKQEARQEAMRKL